jgi:hypothetical protein
VRHRYPNGMAAELIPAVRRRVGAALPAQAATAPLVVLHPISLLGGDVTPGWATRVRKYKTMLNRGHARPVKGPQRRLFESETWKRYALQVISL